eukprot:CAMPEP_0182420340 /NCGR_PEP_ID=MMETSP1167-20130531/5074_1 /TAXON_ID=2988 /ORGANISM="Mallomonas Sp, Strain CCMP3275" /LENGTH=267 /DNA_ID=CAMNT_0024596181 /DNA_START=227 /DNA_END=1027 /DNA_ORIENTATION=+
MEVSENSYGLMETGNKIIYSKRDLIEIGRSTLSQEDRCPDNILEWFRAFQSLPGFDTRPIIPSEAKYANFLKQQHTRAVFDRTSNEKPKHFQEKSGPRKDRPITYSSGFSWRGSGGSGPTSEKSRESETTDESDPSSSHGNCSNGSGGGWGPNCRGYSRADQGWARDGRDRDPEGGAGRNYSEASTHGSGMHREKRERGRDDMWDIPTTQGGVTGGTMSSLIATSSSSSTAGGGEKRSNAVDQRLQFEKERQEILRKRQTDKLSHMM